MARTGGTPECATREGTRNRWKCLWRLGTYFKDYVAVVTNFRRRRTQSNTGSKNQAYHLAKGRPCNYDVNSKLETLRPRACNSKGKGVAQ